MNCANCREPINEGASVWRACGCSQPMSSAKKTRLILGVGIATAAVILGAGVGYHAWDSNERGKAVLTAVAAAAFCDHGRFYNDAAAEGAVLNYHASGLSWDESAKRFSHDVCRQ